MYLSVCGNINDKSVLTRSLVAAAVITSRRPKAECSCRSCQLYLPEDIGIAIKFCDCGIRSGRAQATETSELSDV